MATIPLSMCHVLMTALRTLLLTLRLLFRRMSSHQVKRIRRRKVLSQVLIVIVLMVPPLALNQNQLLTVSLIQNLMASQTLTPRQNVPVPQTHKMSRLLHNPVSLSLQSLRHQVFKSVHLTTLSWSQI